MKATAPLRIIYAGTPDFACAPLQALLDSSHQILAVFTQPDRPAGRGRQLQASPVKQLALQHGLPVYQPERLNQEELRVQMAALQPDLMVVTAYGLLLPQAWLELPRFGCWNLHASLLPRWRGAAPIQRAIAAGDQQTGMTLMQMERGLDTGPMLLKQALEIHPDETAASLHDRLASQAAQVLQQGLERLIQDGPWHGDVQDESQASYAAKLSKEEAELDWRESAVTLERRIRAFNPFPVCWAELNGERTRIWGAAVIAQTPSATPGTLLDSPKDECWVACGEGILALHEVQPAGKRRMPIRDWLNARRT